MKEYIGVDLGKRKAVVVKKDRHGKITGKATLAVTEAALAKYFSKQDQGVRSLWKRQGTGCFYTRLSSSIPRK
jgi:hypothetical protein